MCLAVPCCGADAAGRQVTGDTTAAPLGAPASRVLVRVSWGAGDPQWGVGWRCTVSLSCPGGLCTGAERVALAAKSLLGQPGGCPGCLGAGGGRGLRGPLPSTGVSVTQGGRRCQSLPSPVGVCGVCWRPGTTGRNRFGQPGEALSRSAGVETGTTDARVPLAHPAPWSWWWQVTGTGACSCGVPGWAPRGHLTVGVSPAGGHSWVWGRMGGFTLQAGWPGSAHLLAVPQWGRRGWLGFRALV